MRTGIIKQECFAYFFQTFKKYLLSIYYVPSTIENAEVSMVSSKSPAGLWSPDDKSVNKDID